MKCHFYGSKLLIGFFKSWFHYVVLARRLFSFFFFFFLILPYKMPSCQTPKFLFVCFSAPKLPAHHSVCPWLVRLPQSSTWHPCPENESFQVHQRHLLRNSFICSFCFVFITTRTRATTPVTNQPPPSCPKFSSFLFLISSYEENFFHFELPLKNPVFQTVALDSLNFTLVLFCWVCRFSFVC